MLPWPEALGPLGGAAFAVWLLLDAAEAQASSAGLTGGPGATGPGDWGAGATKGEHKLAPRPLSSPPCLRRLLETREKRRARPNRLL